MPQTKPASSWREDSKEEKEIATIPPYIAIPGSGFIPPHKIDEIFQETHDLEAAVKLTWTIDHNHNKDNNNSYQHTSIYPLRDLETLNRIRTIVAHQAATIPLPNHRIAALHIDKFTINFTDSADRRIVSEIDRDHKKYPVTNTEFSPTTFNALMKATAARISVLDNYCSCDDIENCERAKRCPEVKLWLSSLDRSNRRLCDSFEKVDPDRIVVVRPEMFGLSAQENRYHPKQHDDDITLKLMIDAACLRRLHDRAQMNKTSNSIVETEYQEQLGAWAEDNTTEDSEDTTSRLLVETSELNSSYDYEDPPFRSSQQSPKKVSNPGVIEVEDNSEDDDEIISGQDMIRRSRYFTAPVRPGH